MTYQPNDLIPLPTMPYDERPAELPLDREECRTALWRAKGNVSEAAKLLKVPSLRLRNFIKNNAFLSAEAEEARQILADIAENNVLDALTDPVDAGRRDSMSRFVLSSIGKQRGYGQNTAGITINSPKGPMTISWADGSSVGPKTIDHEAAE